MRFVIFSHTDRYLTVVVLWLPLLCGKGCAAGAVAVAGVGLIGWAGGPIIIALDQVADGKEDCGSSS